MRFFTLIIVLLAVSLFSHAQLRIGLTGGATYSRLTFKDLTLNSTSDIKDGTGNTQKQFLLSNIKFTRRPSILAGLVMDLKITNELSINSKLLFISKGWKENTHEAYSHTASPSYEVDLKEIYRINYFELPVNFTFSVPIGKTKLLLGVGPYIGYAIGGDYVSKVLSDPNSIDSIGFINFSNQAIRIDYSGRIIPYSGARIDYGVSLRTGIEFRNGLYFDIGYGIGLKDVLYDRFNNQANRNKVFNLALGYYLYQSR